MFGRLSIFEKIAEWMKLTSEEEVFESLTKIIDKKLDDLGKDNYGKIVSDIRKVIETEYDLPPNGLKNCFSLKSRHLSEPKRMWVLITCTFIDNDKSVLNLVQNGLKRGHLFRYKKELSEMNDVIKQDLEFKQRFNKIITTYGTTRIL